MVNVYAFNVNFADFKSMDISSKKMEKSASFLQQFSSLFSARTVTSNAN